MRLSVKGSYQVELPKRNKKKTVVIELGKDKHLKTLSSEKYAPETSRLNHTFNTSLDKQNMKSSRSIHRIKNKSKPLSLSKNSVDSIKKQQKNQKSVSIQIDTIKTLHNMIEELLYSKKDNQKTIVESVYQQPQSANSLNIRKVVNMKSRKIQITLPFANLDLVQPQFWDCYEGQLKGQSRHGHGTIYMTNGQKFSGKFQQGKATGNGTFYKKNGETVIGVWKSNKLVKRLI